MTGFGERIMRLKVRDEIVRWMCRAVMGAALASIPLGYGSMSVYAGEESDGDETGTANDGGISLIQRLGDVTSAGTAKSRVQGSAFTTQSSGTARRSMESQTSPAASAASAGSTAPVQGTVHTGIDPTTGLKTVTTEVNLGQSYHQDYDTYELSINGKFFFYSNVGNGDIISKPVTLEMPANIFFTCEKDGVPYAVKSGAPIKEKGTYVLTITASETAGDTMMIYRTSYRFRIASKPDGSGIEEVTDTAGGDEPYDVDVDETIQEIVDENTGNNTEENTAQAESVDDGELTSEERAALNEALNEEDDDDSSIPNVMNDDGTIDQDAVDGITENLSTDGVYTTEGINKKTGMACAYDNSTGYYQNTLRNSMSFYTDVPNGMITKRPVTLRTTDKLEFTVYKDGKPMEYDPEQKFTEIGSYTVIPVAEDVLYYDAYQSETPVFAFRIIGNAVNDLSVYHAPDGFEISEIMVDGLPAESIKKIGKDTALLREEGRYTITVTDGSQVIDTDFLLDRTKPRFFYALEKNRAVIDYKSSDVRETRVYRNGELVTEGRIVTELRDPGDYTLEAYDNAGNRGSAVFTVKYAFNKGAIAAIALVVIALAAFYAYMRYINSKVKVR